METKEIVKALRCCYYHNLDDCEDCKYNESGGFCVDSLKRDAAQRLDELEAELEKRTINDRPYEWISVEERLPEVTDKLHWVYRKCGKITLSTYYSNKNWDYDDVTYWMYFPGFPKPKEPTFKDVFLEKFPKASTNDKGDPKACRALIFGEGRCHHNKCSECWNQPYFEEEEKE